MVDTQELSNSIVHWKNGASYGDGCVNEKGKKKSLGISFRTKTEENAG